MAEGWTVRAMEQAVRGPVAPLAAPVAAGEDVGTGTRLIDGAGLTSATQLRPPGLLELEELLADRLDTRVAVTMGAKRGRVTIDFADLEDLERIYRLMTG